MTDDAKKSLNDIKLNDENFFNLTFLKSIFENNGQEIVDDDFETATNINQSELIFNFIFLFFIL
jgi:hypothetical protein